jgi:hypothetical protein
MAMAMATDAIAWDKPPQLSNVSIDALGKVSSLT